MIDATVEIKKMWQVFAVGPNSVLELRALWPKGVHGSKPPKTKLFRGSEYGDVDGLRDVFQQTAIELNTLGYNVYMVMNPISHGFSGGSAKDADIRYRDLLLIDIDRVGDTSCPANQDELDAAKSLADKIQAYMLTQSWPEPIRVMSGNGYHLYYVLEEFDNSAESTAIVKTTLNDLAAMFDNDIVAIDTTVYNASRITKVPGTVMRKGIETEDRPYRMAVVCDE